MTSIAYSPVNIQTSAHSVPSTPSWFGEVTLFAHHLQRQGVLAAIEEQVRFARRRFGRYEVIDFLAVLFGYAISGERTLEAFYERLQPWASAFMALFGRDRLPARSTLSRFLASLDQAAVEALRTLFLNDLLARPREQRSSQAGCGIGRGTTSLSSMLMARARPPANAPCRRQRIGLRPSGACVPCVPLATPGASEEKSCARAPRSCKPIPISGSAPLEILAMANTGQNCVEQWQPSKAISRRTTIPKSVPCCAWMGNMAQEPSSPIWPDWRLSCVAKTISCLKRAEVQARLHLPPDQHLTHPESGIVRALYDCPDLPLGPEGMRCRVIVATHPAGTTKSRIGVTRSGVVYELFLTNLPQSAFTAADVVALYLHRGAFENALADEDQEQDPDRWCSHAAWVRKCWQIISQWVWNLRLELGHQLHPDPVRTTEFAPALPLGARQASRLASPPQGYGPAEVALPWKAGRFSGQDFLLQPDGTLRCPAGQSLVVHERRREADGSLRVVYAASIRSCRPCPLREQCQWHGSATAKPRQVSVLAASARRRFCASALA